ncbi:MAG: fused MFS/spermidine synthase, partial [Kiritimatiellae bacterium]|nr:fused MFS/spermidine synthase [Kiritimatiellia bacterium]
MILISCLVFLSGFSALVYELLWLRHLGLIFGNTIYAATTILVVFMGGFGIGAYFAGRWSERTDRPIWIFGILQAIIGLYAVVMPYFFDLIRIAYKLSYQNYSEFPVTLIVLRFILALILLMVPTILMGATLPVLSAGILREKGTFGKGLGLLYGLNTLGGVGGVLSCGFLLIPSIGLRGTNLLAVVINLLVGVLAITYSFKFDNSPLSDLSNTEPATDSQKKCERNVIFVLIAIGFSGFLALAFEVVWFRALILIFGSTTYSFSAMLAVFLLGIALGPMIFGPFIDRVKQPSVLFAVSGAGIGLYTLLSMYQFGKGPEFLLFWLLRYGFTWESMTAAKFIITMAFLLVSTFLFGIAFTVAARMVRDLHVSPSKTVGSVYAFNTIGSVAGSFLAGFVFLPFLGMELSLIMLSCLALFLALFVLQVLGGSWLVKTNMTALSFIVLLVLVVCPPHWDKRVLASGAYFGPWNFVKNGQITFRERILSDRLLLYDEGLSSTASVSKSEDEGISFCIDGKTEADTTPRGMMLQRMMGHLPMLFHPDPRRVLNIGLGAGVTLGALACYPAEHVEAVEIEPVVQKVALLWQNFNHCVLSRTNVLITINDGRNHLFATARKYDVITADPFEPMMGGAANLYTVEHFLQAKNCLENGGVMAQFLPLYELSREDVRIIQNSFSAVFTNTLVFFAGYETILLGFKDSSKVNWQILQQKFNVPGVRDSMKEIGVSGPGMILGMFVGKLP